MTDKVEMRLGSMTKKAYEPLMVMSEVFTLGACFMLVPLMLVYNTVQWQFGLRFALETAAGVVALVCLIKASMKSRQVLFSSPIKSFCDFPASTFLNKLDVALAILSLILLAAMTASMLFSGLKGALILIYVPLGIVFRMVVSWLFITAPEGD